MKRRGFFALAVLVVLGFVLSPRPSMASTPPDFLAHYTVAITPQSDGMLVMLKATAAR